MRTLEAEREEMQTKIRMVLEANGAPMTVKEIREHPTMSGISGQKIGNNLFHMPGVKMGKGKRWAVVAKKTKVVRPQKKAKAKTKRGPYKKQTVEIETNPKFSFKITADGQLMIRVHGVLFPVEVE